MRQSNNENAANRYSYVGHVYSIGEKRVKENLLQELPQRWANLHTNGYIHIHDLDAYGLTYNCLTFDIKKLDIDFLYNEPSHTGQIIGLFLLYNVSSKTTATNNQAAWPLLISITT